MLRRRTAVAALLSALVLPTGTAVAAPEPGPAAATAAPAATQADPLWARTLSVPSTIFQPSGLAVDPSTHRVYVQATEYYTPLATYEVPLVTYTDNGGGGGMRDQPTGGVRFPMAYALATDQVRGVVYTLGGGSRSGPGYRTYLSAFGPTGEARWTAGYAPADGGSATGRDLVVDPASGRIYVLLRSSVRTERYYYLTVVAYSPTGEQLWVAEERQPYDLYPTAVTVDSRRATVYVTSAGGETAHLSAYDVGGARRWTGELGTPAVPLVVAVDPRTGTVVVSGRASRRLHTDIVTAALSSAGVPSWVQRYDAGDDDAFGGMAIDPATGTVVVTGASSPVPGPPYEAVTLAYTITGQPLWTRRYSATTASNDSGRDLVIDPARGRIYVAGDSGAADPSVFPSDLLTLVYDMDGSLLRADRYAPAPDSINTAVDIGLDPGTGRVFVLGTTTPDYATGESLLTVAYPPAG